MDHLSHDQATEVLFSDKSLDALCFLIEQGRELEFTYGGVRFFLSRSNSSAYVSLWQADTEQSFDSIHALFHHAMLNHVPFHAAWINADPEILF